MDGTNAQRAGRDTAPGNPSISKADKAARNAEASARYKQAMAKCDAVSGGAKFTCREEAEQERRDALAQAATDGNNAVRRSRTGGDALSANDDPEYRNVSTARGDTK